MSAHSSRRNGHAPAPRLRPQLIADAVVATYIQDISQRNRRGAGPRRGVRAARFGRPVGVAHHRPFA